MILIICFLIWPSKPINIILESIGCSAFAASLMAIFISFIEKSMKKSRIEEYKKIFLSPIQNEMASIFETILWFDENINLDSLNWNLQLNEYAKLDFFVFANKYNSTKKYSFEEAKIILNELSNKYSYDSFLKMDIDTQLKVRKIFLIVSQNMRFLFDKLNNLVSNQTFLDNQDVISVSSIEKIANRVILTRTLFTKENKNIGGGITLLLIAYESLYELNRIEREIAPRFHLGIYYNEI